MNDINRIMQINGIGQFPKLKFSIFNTFAIIGILFLTAVPVYNSTFNITTSFLVGVISVCLVWALQRYADKKDNNNGWHWLTDEPVKNGEKINKAHANIEMGDIYSKIYDEKIVVELVEDHPRFYVHVIYHEDANLGDTRKLGRLSRELGIETEVGKKPPLTLVHSWKKGASAFVIPRTNEDEISKIKFDESKIEKGKLKSFLGIDVRGRDIGNDRSIAAHALFTGITGAGKTITFRNEILSMFLARPDSIIFSIDCKSGIKVAPHTVFTSDNVSGLKLLDKARELAKGNWSKILGAGLDNWFEYNKEIGSLPPIFINIDEFPQFQADVNKHILEDWAEEKAMAKRNKEPAPIKPDMAVDIIGEFVKVYRAAGCFFSIGAQKAKAEELPTQFRDMFDCRVAMRATNSTASKVAIDATGAELLPDRGGMMFRSASNPIQIGASAFIEKNEMDRFKEKNKEN